MLGVDMEVNEIGIFYIEENLSTPYHWDIKFPQPSPAANGNPGPLGNNMDYISHVFELVSSEYRPKPALPGVTGTGGIRIFAIRGRKPNEIEIPERIKAKLRAEAIENPSAMYPYVTPLNTDYFTLILRNVANDEGPIWLEDLEITVLSSEEYKLNLFL